MELFARAYVQAVAAVVGCHATKPDVDDDSVDLIFMRRTLDGPVRSPRLDVQLKTTARDPLAEEMLTLELSIKNYDDLRGDDVSTPRLLVVVVVPSELHEWMNHSEVELAMRRCGYWLSLRGEPPVTNAATKTVHLNRRQVFDASALEAIFRRLQAGGLP
jgi:hypothetical protein